MVFLASTIATLGFFLLLLLSAPTLVLMIAWVNKANVGTSIAIDGDRITLRDHTGRDSSCLLKDARYDESAIATKDAVVFLGRPLAWVYARDAVKNELLPRLEAAQKVQPMTMMKIFIDLRHPQGIVTVGSAVLLVAYLIYLAAEKTSGFGSV